LGQDQAVGLDQRGNRSTARQPGSRSPATALQDQVGPPSGRGLRARKSARLRGSSLHRARAAAGRCRYRTRSTVAQLVRGQPLSFLLRSALATAQRQVDYLSAYVPQLLDRGRSDRLSTVTRPRAQAVATSLKLAASLGDRFVGLWPTPVGRPGHTTRAKFSLLHWPERKLRRRDVQAALDQRLRKRSPKASRTGVGPCVLVGFEPFGGRGGLGGGGQDLGDVPLRAGVPRRSGTRALGQAQASRWSIRPLPAQVLDHRVQATELARHKLGVQRPRARTGNRPVIVRNRRRGPGPSAAVTSNQSKARPSPKPEQGGTAADPSRCAEK